MAHFITTHSINFTVNKKKEKKNLARSCWEIYSYTWKNVHEVHFENNI